MYFNKISYNDDYNTITYDTCKRIWDNRGYRLKKEQTADNKRLPYRRIYIDTGIIKTDSGPYGPCLAISYIGWNHNPNFYSDAPILLWVYPDKIVVNNIAKHHYGNRDSTQKNHSHWGFNRMLTRIAYLCNRTYIERKTSSEKILDKDGKNIHDVFYSFEFAKSIVLTNKYDSPNHISMTTTSDIQASMLTSGNAYHSYGRRKYTAFLESGADAKSVSESRASITSLGLLREYTLNYVSSLLQNEHNKQNLIDFCQYSDSPYVNNNKYSELDVPVNIDEHMRYFNNIGYGVPTQDQSASESQSNKYKKLVEKNNLVRSSSWKRAWNERSHPDELPVAMTHLYPQIITSKESSTNTFREYMTQDCISDTMGFGLSKEIKGTSSSNNSLLSVS